MNFLRRLMFWKSKPKRTGMVFQVPPNMRYVTVVVTGHGGGGGSAANGGGDGFTIAGRTADGAVRIMAQEDKDA